MIRSQLAAFVQDQCGFLAWLPRSGGPVSCSVDSGPLETEDTLPFKPPVDSENALTDLPTSTTPSSTEGSGPQ